MKLTFTVPGTPVPKARARVVRGGKAFTPERTSRYERTVGAYALQARCAVSRWPMDARYVVEARFFRERADGDIDNLVKSLLDGCNGVVWNDDRQVRRLVIDRPDCDGRERVEVSIEVWGGEAAP